MRIHSLFFLLVSISCYGQRYSKQDDLKFTKYLLESKHYEDAIILLNQYKPHERNDSINYFLGKAYYLNQNLAKSTDHFRIVNANSDFYLESQFLSTICLSYSNQVNTADSLLGLLKIKDPLLLELKYFEQSGLSLLKRDNYLFQKSNSYLTNTYYHFTKPKQEFLQIKQTIDAFKPKSAVAAGLLSAVVPGLGKIYTKKTGEGIATFFKLALIGLPALEALNKKGVEDPRFIVFASIFSIGYVANIWGSVVSVSVRRREFNKKIDDQILVNMHIPIRSIFN